MGIDVSFLLRQVTQKHAFHSQTEQVEWLLFLISTLYDVITSLQGVFTHVIIVVWNLLISGWC